MPLPSPSATGTPPLSKMQKAFARVMDAVRGACGLCIGGMAFAVTYEIVARAVFGEPTIWAQEVSVYLLLAVAFLGLGPTLAGGDHIEIDLLTRRLGGRVRAGLRALILLVIALYATLAAWGGIDMVAQSVRFGRRSLTLLAVPVWIPQLLIPAGMGLLAVAALAGVLAALRGGDARKTDG